VAFRRQQVPVDTLALSRALESLAGSLYFQRAFDEVVEPLEESVRLVEAYYGPDHPGLAGSYLNLGGLLAQLERFDEAATMRERAYQFNLRALGPDSPATAHALAEYAAVVRAAGDPARALDLATQAAAVLRRVQPVHYQTAMAIRRQAQALVDLDRPAEAAPLAREAYAMVVQALGPDHQQVAMFASLAEELGAARR
jgi:tetratricopeptide (TPR) repeat protein